MDRELMIPPLADDEDDAFEILRVWASGGQQHVTLRSNLSGGPAEFGFLLAQLARHGANLYSEREKRARIEVLKEIRQGFDEEWRNPTATATGGT